MNREDEDILRRLATNQPCILGSFCEPLRKNWVLPKKHFKGITKRSVATPEEFEIVKALEQELSKIASFEYTAEGFCVKAKCTLKKDIEYYITRYGGKYHSRLKKGQALYLVAFGTPEQGYYCHFARSSYRECVAPRPGEDLFAYSPKAMANMVITRFLQIQAH